MSDLILYAKPSTAKQPRSERFSGTLAALSGFPPSYLSLSSNSYLVSQCPFARAKSEF